MPIALPEGLPAIEELRTEGLLVLSEGQTLSSLRILVINLMPKKAETERQIARLLGSSTDVVHLTFCVPGSYYPRTTPTEHLDAFYKPWNEIRDQSFDGLIVTGAPVEQLPFENVSYWNELTQILEWARLNIGQSLYICWAAQAALYYYHGVRKHDLPEKMFGVFRHKICDRTDVLVRGLGEDFNIPVSRHTEVRSSDLEQCNGVEVLSESDKAGLCLLADRTNNATYIFNHFEYETDTLLIEYFRDVARGKPIRMPRNYFPGDAPNRAPVNNWSSHGHIFYRNWTDLVSLTARENSKTDVMLDWLLAERRDGMNVSESFTDFLVNGSDGLNTLPHVLRQLGQMELHPEVVKVHHLGRRQTLIELRINDIQEGGALRVARHLLRSQGVHRISFQTSQGRGATFSFGENSSSPAQSFFTGCPAIQSA